MINIEYLIKNNILEIKTDGTKKVNLPNFFKDKKCRDKIRKNLGLEQ